MSNIPSKEDPDLMKGVIEADLDKEGICLLPSQRARIRALKPDDPNADDLYYVTAHLVQLQEPWSERGPTWLRSRRLGPTTTTPSSVSTAFWPTPTVPRSFP